MYKHPCDFFGTFAEVAAEAIPLPGTPGYEGPDYRLFFKESPFGMPTSDKVMARPAICQNPEQNGLLWPIVAALGRQVALLGNLPSGNYPWENLPLLGAEIFDGGPSPKVAQKLQAAGYYYLLVNRTSWPLKPWLDDNNSTLIYSLRNITPAACFHPQMITEELVLYKIGSNFQLSSQQISSIFKYLRTFLQDGQAVVPGDLKTKAVNVDGQQRLIVSLRQGARRLLKKMGHGKTMAEALENVAKRLQGGMRDKNLPAIDQLQLEIEVAFDLCQIMDRRINHLWQYMELGIHGLLVQHGNSACYLEPSAAVTGSIPSAAQFLEQLCVRTGLDEMVRPASPQAKHKRKVVLDEQQWQKNPAYCLFRFHTQHYLESPDGRKLLSLYRGVPRVKMADVSREALINSLKLGADWLVNNQLADGQFAYRYDPIAPAGRRWLDGNNIVRHSLNPYNLVTVYALTKDDRYLESAKKGLAYTFEKIKYFEGRALIVHEDAPAPYPNAKLGTAVVVILSLLKLRELTGDKSHDDLILDLADEMLYLQDPNGHFRSYDVPQNHPYYGAENMIVPGEALFALARLAITFGIDKYRQPIDKTIEYYMAAWRYRREMRSPEGIYTERLRTDLVCLVPWMVTAFDHLHRLTNDIKYVNWAFEMEDWLENEFYFSEERCSYPDYLGSSFKSHYELPAINACQYAEGAAHAYELAARINDVSAPGRRQRLLEMMRFCLQLQYRDYSSTYFLPKPEEAMGGYRYTIGHLHLRSDYSYHAMAAIAQAVESLWPDEKFTGSEKK